MTRIYSTILVSILVCATGIAGPLEPEEAPAPTMKTLDEVEARIPINTPDSFPIIIDRAGSYYLTEDILAVGTHAVLIITERVTLDLNGYAIRSNDEVGNSNGIYFASNEKGTGPAPDHVTIKNGFIRGFTGSGIFYNIKEGPNIGLAFHDLVVANNAGHGIFVRNSQGIMSNIQVLDNGSKGLACGSCILESVIARGNGGDGIEFNGMLQHGHVSLNGSGDNSVKGVDCTLAGATIVKNVIAYNNGSEPGDNFGPSCTQFENLSTEF